MSTDSETNRLEGFVYQDEFIVSETEKKSYRHIVLANGLSVLLIHEPEGLLTPTSYSNSSADPPTKNPDGGSRQSRCDFSLSSSSQDSHPGRDNAADSSEEEDNGDEYDEGEESEDTGAFDVDTPEDGYRQEDRRGGGGGNFKRPASGARRSAAALCVGSGSADEGDQLPGLAHFLEHMLFMGSAKYPSENDFDAFVSERGGDTNAWTDMEATQFYFDCRPESFAECLDRFANFFVEPLMSADCLEREVQAVHSEFEHACNSLHSQLEYFLGSLANESHPLSGFKWGNSKSLWDGPKSAGIDVRSKLAEFRLAHYRAGNMTAALQSRLSLDIMEATARAAFAKIPAGKREAPAPDALLLPFGRSFMGRCYYLLPVKQIDQLFITWQCPTVRGSHMAQPHRLISFCLAHEGAGSLADCLRREGLAVDLSAGVLTSGSSDNSWASMMNVTVKLTVKGLMEWRRVVRLVYAYIGMLGSRLDELSRVYEELRSVERAAWRFAEEVEPSDSVEAVSVNMMRLPKMLWLLGEHTLPHVFDAEALRRYWEALRPGNACVLIASRSFEAACDKKTKWFEMHYSELASDPSCIADWERCVTCPDLQLLEELQLHLPPSNPFIASNFSVPTPEEVYREMGLPSVPEFPLRLLLDKPDLDKFGALYFYKDRKFKTPRAVVRVNFESPAICESAKSFALAQVWLYMLNFQLHRNAYAASEAGLSYEVLLVQPFSILIDLEGFSDKLFVLYSTILDKWAQIGGMLEASDPALKFDSTKEEVRKGLANQLFSSKSFGNNLRHFLLEQDRYLISDTLSALESVQLADVAEFHRRLLFRVFVRAYVHGNCRSEDAKEYFRRSLQLLIPESNVAELKNTCAALPLGRNGVRLLNMRPGDVNCLLVEEFQLEHPPNLRTLVLADLLLHIMWEPCFHFLRTKHQLGYHVTCSASRRHGHLSFLVMVASQADKCSMDKLQLMVDSFAAEFADHVKSLTDSQFANYLQAVVDVKMAEDSSMTDEADRLWAEILDDGLMFDRRMKETEVLRDLRIQELLPLYERAIIEARRSFSFQIEGSTAKSMQEGGTAGFSLPLAYSKTAAGGTSPGRGSSLSFTGPVAYSRDVSLFKIGLRFDTAKPVVI